MLPPQTARSQLTGSSGARLPNFFLVGAGKTGTTSLHSYLDQHPQIYMSPVKEPCYFADEIRAGRIGPQFEQHLRRQSRKLDAVLQDGGGAKPLGWIAQDLDDYLRLFAKACGEVAIGEASAAYLWSPTAAANIHAAIPHAKIIMILRDPSERAFSQYLHQLSAGLTRMSFREHLERCRRADHARLSIFYPFLEIGTYSAQVKRFLDLFPREQVRIYWYEEAWRNPPHFFAELFDFLGVDAEFAVDSSRRSLQRRRPRWSSAHYWLKQSRLWYPLRALVPARFRPAARSAVFSAGASIRMEPSDREYLIDFYREDILRLAAMLDRDLSAWMR